jgi:hypothetical protein
MPKALASAEDQLPTAYHVLFLRRKSATGQKAAPASGLAVSDITALIGKEVEGKITSISVIYSR